MDTIFSIWANLMDTLRTSKHIIMDNKKDMQGQQRTQGYPFVPRPKPLEQERLEIGGDTGNPVVQKVVPLQRNQGYPFVPRPKSLERERLEIGSDTGNPLAQKGVPLQRNQGYPLNSPKVVPFGSSSMESFAISLAKKCERLSTALYLVTNFLLDIEPMKYRLRARSIDLVRDASLVRYGTASNETNVLEALRANISETLSLLELAFIAGLVSEMNFSILKREYVSLRDYTDIKKASRESRTDAVLGDTFFDSAESCRVSRLGAASLDSAPRIPSIVSGQLSNVAHESDLYVPESRTTSIVSGQLSNVTLPPTHPIGHSKGQSNIKMSDRNAQQVSSSASAPKDPPLRNFDSTESYRASHLGATIQRVDIYSLQPAAKIPNTIQKEARHTRILKLIKDNREVSIKDITSYFPELSEKTIQRELVAFTQSGVLKKSGERRWSRYSLA